MKALKSWKKFNESRTRWQSDDSPINYNSGAYSFHLNFDIRDITNTNPPIYPGKEFTTDSEGKDLLEKFVQAIQKHDISKIKSFRNGKETLFDEEAWGVTCGSNNLNMRKIPKKIWNYTEFKTGPYDSNYLNERDFELTTPVKELEAGKIYTAFTFTDYGQVSTYTGIIDVTEEVKKFIEMNKM